MFIKDIIHHANNLADDLIPSEDVLGFINDGIAAINVDAEANYPMIEPYGYDYAEIDMPETWIRMLIIPYVKARIKEKDSSQFEWETAYEQFFSNLGQFIVTYEIPEKYKAQKKAPGNLLNNAPYVWGGW